MLGNDEFMAALEALGGELDKFHQLVESQAERSEGLANCLRRTQEIQERLVTWRAPEAPEVIRWVEVFTQSLALNATPLHVSDVFRRQMGNQPKAWIFTSATLAVGSDFTHYLNEMGLSDLDPPTETAVWGSPFDYGEQAMLFARRACPTRIRPTIRSGWRRWRFR